VDLAISPQKLTLPFINSSNWQNGENQIQLPLLTSSLGLGLPDILKNPFEPQNHSKFSLLLRNFIFSKEYKKSVVMWLENVSVDGFEFYADISSVIFTRRFFCPMR